MGILAKIKVYNFTELKPVFKQNLHYLITELLQESNRATNVSDVFHICDGFIIYEDRSNGPAKTHRTYSERTFGVKARHDERDDEQSQRHEALRLSALDTTSI